MEQARGLQDLQGLSFLMQYNGFPTVEELSRQRRFSPALYGTVSFVTSSRGTGAPAGISVYEIIIYISVIYLQNLFNLFFKLRKVIILLFDFSSSFYNFYISFKSQLIDLLNKRLLIVQPYIKPLLVIDVVLQIAIYFYKGDTFFLYFFIVL